MWSKYPEILSELTLVENFIKMNINSRNKLLADIVGELVDSGGKRLRPAFVILSSKFGKCDTAKLVSLAGALEILHTATLVHDDVIDKSKLRRGRVTVSEKYGIDMAVYTGDFLFTKAVLMLSRDISVDRLDIVAKSIKIICEGEVDQYEGKFNINTSVLSYLKRINRKTAVLFGAACGLGAHLAECPESTVKLLAKFGFCYGMAFQIRDDLNDYLSTKGIEGKPVFKDIVEGVVTLPAIITLNKSKEFKKKLNSFFAEKFDLLPDDITYMTDLVKQHGGIDETKALLDKYITRGIQILENLPDNIYKPIFKELLEKLK